MTMQTTVVTADALELMIQLNAGAKDLLEAFKAFKEDFEELKLSTVKPSLLTTQEAAKYLGIAYPTMKQYQSEGQTGNRIPMPPFVRIGSKVLYDFDDLSQWKKDLPRQRRTRPSEEALQC